MTVAGGVSLKVSASETKNGVTIGSAQWSGGIDKNLSFASGVGAGQFDLIYSAERTVATGANDDIDLNGVLTSVLGTAFTAAEGVLVSIVNENSTGVANTTNLTIGGGTGPWLGFLGGTVPTIGPIRPGGFFTICNPDSAGLGTITATTADILRVTNSAGASNTYRISVFARSA